MAGEDDQRVLPPSFLALFVPEGRVKPTASREEMLARHEFCEDLATMLSERAAEAHWRDGVDEGEVLRRIGLGLGEPATGLSAAEAGWVASRIAEIVG
jgi:hypothetical protein